MHGLPNIISLPCTGWNAWLTSHLGYAFWHSTYSSTPLTSCFVPWLHTTQLPIKSLSPPRSLPKKMLTGESKRWCLAEFSIPSGKCLNYLRGISSASLTSWIHFHAPKNASPYTNGTDKVFGKLHSLTLAVLGLRGFFSLLQEGLCHFTQARLCLAQGMHNFLGDICRLAAFLDSCCTCPFGLAHYWNTDQEYPSLGMANQGLYHHLKPQCIATLVPGIASIGPQLSPPSGTHFGSANAMTHACFCCWDLSDLELLSHFDTTTHRQNCGTSPRSVSPCASGTRCCGNSAA